MRKILTGLVVCLLAPFTLAGHHEKGEMSANVMAAKAGYDAFNAGDMEAWAATMAENSEWTMQGGLPYSGTYYGAAEVKEKVLDQVAALWTNFQVQPIAFYESGDKVFIHVKMTADGLDTEALHMATIKDGKFAAFRPFENTGLMMAAAKK